MNLKRVFPFELKADAGADAGEAGTFTGYGSVFGTLDSYNDTIAPGAFRASLAEWRIKGKLPKMLLQHGGGFFGGTADDLVPIGKWEDMREDEHGLLVRGRLFLADTDRAKGLHAAMLAGELDGLSIGFRTRKSKTDNDTGVRTLTEIDLVECSVVTFPANAPALIDSVKAEGDLPTEREIERWLRRDGGFTELQAKRFIADGYRAVRRDAKLQREGVGDLLESLSRRAAIFHTQ
jgi:HK97 family phage prohead protease